MKNIDLVSASGSWIRTVLGQREVKINPFILQVRASLCILNVSSTEFFAKKTWIAGLLENLGELSKRILGTRLYSSVAKKIAWAGDTNPDALYPH